MTETNSAERIVELFYLIKREWSGRTLQDALLRTSRYELKKDVTAIIEMETRVGEKEKALREIVQTKTTAPMISMHMKSRWYWSQLSKVVELARAALAEKST